MVERRKTARTSPSKPRAPRRAALARVIATELAPAVTIALLSGARSSSRSGDLALEPIVAGVKAATRANRLRLELLFQNGALLPIDIDSAAARALMAGLQEQLDAMAGKSARGASRRLPTAP